MARSAEQPRLTSARLDALWDALRRPGARDERRQRALEQAMLRDRFVSLSDLEGLLAAQGVAWNPMRLPLEALVAATVGIAPQCCYFRPRRKREDVVGVSGWRPGTGAAASSRPDGLIGAPASVTSTSNRPSRTRCRRSLPDTATPR